MTTMPKPYGPEDERFVYVVTAAGVEVVRERTVACRREVMSRAELSDERQLAAPAAANSLPTLISHLRFRE